MKTKENIQNGQEKGNFRNQGSRIVPSLKYQILHRNQGNETEKGRTH